METNIYTENSTENAQTTSEVVKAIVAFDKRIETLKELKESGKKFARLENNRVINRKNVDDKKRSIKEVGVLQTITVVEAKKVVELGYKVVDFETGEEISDPESYKVIIDGQHRYTAFKELSKEATEKGEVFDKELSVTTLIIEGISLLKVLYEINNRVNKWDGRDFPGALDEETLTKYPLLSKIKLLTNEGYSLDSACKWLTFKNEITKAVLSNVVSGEKLPEKIIPKITNLKGIERGLNILESAKKRLSETVLKSRTVIDWIISKYDYLDDRGKGTFETDMCSFFESIDKKQSETIEKAKGTRGVNTKEDIILKSLNKFYNDFQNNKRRLHNMEHNFETVEEMQRFWFEVKEQLKNNPYSKSFEIDKIEDRTNVILFQKAIIGLNTETLLALGSILNFEIIERIENIEEQYINDETGDLNENEYQEKLAEINEKAIKVMSKFDYDFSKCNLFQILNIEKK